MAKLSSLKALEKAQMIQYEIKEHKDRNGKYCFVVYTLSPEGVKLNEHDFDMFKDAMEFIKQDKAK